MSEFCPREHGEGHTQLVPLAVAVLDRGEREPSCGIGNSEAIPARDARVEEDSACREMLAARAPATEYIQRFVSLKVLPLFGS